MTKDVVVTISGFHMSEEIEDGDAIELVHIGQYYERNGTHYILYEERMEGIPEPVKNMIKVRDSRMELRKTGPVTANMVFEENKSQSSTYAIPYGSFLMETSTSRVGLQAEGDTLTAPAAYQLRVNGVYCASCEIRVLVQSREAFQL